MAYNTQYCATAIGDGENYLAVKQAVEDEFRSVVSPICFQTNTIPSETNGGSHPDILSEEYTPLLNEPQPVLESHVVVQEETTLNFSSTSHSCSAHDSRQKDAHTELSRHSIGDKHKEKRTTIPGPA